MNFVNGDKQSRALSKKMPLHSQRETSWYQNPL